MMTDVLSAEELEVERLHDWLFDRFLELGFEVYQAQRLEFEHADWHKAAELLEQGCSHKLALKLLT